MEPLTALIDLLRPQAVAQKLISGAGKWAVRYGAIGHAGFGLLLKGTCTLRVDGAKPVRLRQGDFVLMPPTSGFAMYSDAKAKPLLLASDASTGLAELRHGDATAAPDCIMLGGYFSFARANIDLLTALLPALVHIEAGDVAATRLASTAAAIRDEALSQRPGRDLILTRLVEVLLIESLRAHGASLGAMAQPGLLAGLSDPQLAKALHSLHADIAHHWTVAALAREAGLSRSAFSERFAHTIGAPPMEYLMQWRMAVAKDMLQRDRAPFETVALAIGYESASAFSTAFRRQIGTPPSAFARKARAVRAA